MSQNKHHQKQQDQQTQSTTMKTSPSEPEVVEQTEELKPAPQTVTLPSNSFSKPSSVPASKFPKAPTVGNTSHQASGYRVPKPLMEGDVKDWIAKVGNADLTVLYEELLYLDELLSTERNLTAEAAAQPLMSLYTKIKSVVETPAKELDFRNKWTLVLRMMSESPKGGLLANRVFRGKPWWTKGHEEFRHFEAIYSLIDASVRYGKDYNKFVEEKNVMRGFTPQGQGQLGLFYREFQG